MELAVSTEQMNLPRSATIASKVDCFVRQRREWNNGREISRTILSNPRGSASTIEVSRSEQHQRGNNAMTDTLTATPPCGSILNVLSRDLKLIWVTRHHRESVTLGSQRYCMKFDQ